MGAIALAFYSYFLIISTYKAAYTTGYDEGLEDGRESMSFKEQLKINKQLLSEVCYTWWFKIPPVQKVVR
jgi:hypothetical protein